MTSGGRGRRGRAARNAPSAFSGQANLAVAGRDGSAYHYAGNEENPVFQFRLGQVEIASTGIYPLDRSLFRFVAPAGEQRRRLALRETAVLA